jgi:hypothetical protein
MAFDDPRASDELDQPGRQRCRRANECKESGPAHQAPGSLLRCRAQASDSVKVGASAPRPRHVTDRTECGPACEASSG